MSMFVVLLKIVLLLNMYGFLGSDCVFQMCLRA